jgi:hypothetical protein
MAAAELELEVVAAEVVTVVVDITAHLGGRLTVNWHWRLIGLL